MPNASEEHQAQLWEPVGLADGLMVLGRGLDEVGTARGDGEAWLWEIEHASRHPEHIAAALSQIRRRTAVAA